jgi:hypothetical protein
MRVSGCNNHYKAVLGAGAKVEERSDEIPPWRGKKCDKQLTHIVRVIFRPVLKLSDLEKLSQCCYLIDFMNSPAVMTGILLSLKSC